jgi:hypothetical protein
MNYDGLTAATISLIADAGRAVSLVYTTQGTYNPSDDEIYSQAETSETVYMVITNFKKSDVDGTLIKAGDRLALLANDNLSRAPKTGDKVEDSETYTIVGIEEIKPGDTVLLYKLQLRR